jgi:acyl-CoA thioesterase-1
MFPPIARRCGYFNPQEAGEFLPMICCCRAPDVIQPGTKATVPVGPRYDRNGRMIGRIVLTASIAAVSLLGTARDVSAQIVALGASATAGYGLPPSESFPSQLQAMLQAKGSATRVINAGVSGETTGEILARIDSSVPEGTKIVILSIFMLNDARRGISPAEHRSNLASILWQLHGRRSQVIDASGLIASAARAGLVQRDRLHLTAEGNRRVAKELAASLR